MTALTHSLTGRILIAMSLGIIVGILCHALIPSAAWIDTYLANGLFYIVGKAFVGFLKMLVVPLVFVSLVCGVCALADIRAVGRIGGKAIVYYLLTTAIAISIALTLAIIVQPGAGVELAKPAAAAAVKTAPSLTEVLLNMVPSNPVNALANGEMLQIIIFAILFGLAVTLAGEKGATVGEFFQSANDVVMSLVSIVMKIAPYGVFCLVAKTFAQLGFSAIAPLAAYFALVISALLIHCFVTYSIVLKYLARVSPVMFFRKMRAAMVLAFSTASSNATIPATLEATEKRIGASNRVASFTVPLGATINMDGTAIMQGVATVFIANIYAINLGIGDYVAVVLTATLASIGTAGVPGVGLIMLALVLRQVGVPVEGIALIVGIDRLLDMLRTAVNITGDAVATTVIAHSEGALDRTILDDPEAGVIQD